MAKKAWLYNELNELVAVGTQQIPLKIIKESRKNVRSSIGKDAVYLRIPYWTNKKETEKLKNWCIQWLRTKHKDSGILKSLQKRNIHDGYLIHLPKEIIDIKIKYASRKSGKGQIRKQTIFLELPFGLLEEDEQSLCRKIINNLLGQRYQPVLTNQLIEINSRTFKEDIKSVKLRYNYSKWGSCSTNRNISLSTRLIFCPDEVIDYVIIHELAHLIEMNHSSRFWDIVSSAMPEYESHEKWLKGNTWGCDY